MTEREDNRHLWIWLLITFEALALFGHYFVQMAGLH